MWNVNELLQNTVNQTPNRTAVVDPVSERRFSYAELDEKVEQVAAGLRAFGIEKGDRVGTALPNTPEHVFLFLAVQRVGAVAVPFDYRITDKKLRYFVSDAELSLLAFGETVAEQVMDLREELDCDTFVTTADVSASGVDEYETLVREPDGPITTKVHPEDLSVVQYSSGTTGDPKGIKITHRGGIDRAFLNIHTQEDYDRRLSSVRFRSTTPSRSTVTYCQRSSPAVRTSCFPTRNSTWPVR
ncbi:AMP-binding protein [Halorussus caseinilyticus]|uniref:AMP-binding protein n=1 Tax=Halorussus caseinilyticus TaxID=3034025 RepID=A0ABD5WL98_9EURY